MMELTQTSHPTEEFHRWPVGSAGWTWYRRGEPPYDECPGFLLKVGDGTARSEAIGPNPRLNWRTMCRIVDRVALAFFLIRLGRYPYTFPIVVNHYGRRRKRPPVR